VKLDPLNLNSHFWLGNSLTAARRAARRFELSGMPRPWNRATAGTTVGSESLTI
jgi:hypothetical protein